MASESAPTSPVHILIAEDSPTQAARLRYLLEKQGYTVTTAANGNEALAKTRSLKPTMLLSDIVMPEMDGYELCTRMKADAQLKHVPVILVTTLSDPHDVIRGLEAGADNFIVKPYDNDLLLARIQFVLVNRSVGFRDQSSAGVEIHFAGERHVINSDPRQILSLLLSTYEAAVQRNQELVRTKEALRAANSALEDSNKELEAFSYSASHDLQAPLRAVEAYTQELLKDPAHAPAGKSGDLLPRILNACHRAQSLIHDLLTLSRVSRSQMRKEHINLSTLARSILEELQRTAPQRQATFQIQDAVCLECDPQLMRIALENLFNNAWKFTAKQARTIIEFGTASHDGRTACFVRDNGAGFDMAHAGKLFEAFQRLHSAQEFPGTGIGLATVQRIIHRHGGTIWARATPGQGAAFYFSWAGLNPTS